MRSAIVFLILSVVALSYAATYQVENEPAVASQETGTTDELVRAKRFFGGGIGFGVGLGIGGGYGHGGYGGYGNHGYGHGGFGHGGYGGYGGYGYGGHHHHHHHHGFY